MKKLFTLLLTIGSFTAVFAQDHRNNDRNNNYYDQHDRNVAYNNPSQRGYGNNTMYNDHSQQSRQMNDRERQQQIDRINRDYDHRINDYRNDRSISSYERNRRIAQMEQERRQQTGSFVKGAVVGGVIGVLLGAVLSH